MERQMKIQRQKWQTKATEREWSGIKDMGLAWMHEDKVNSKQIKALAASVIEERCSEEDEI